MMGLGFGVWPPGAVEGMVPVALTLVDSGKQELGDLRRILAELAGPLLLAGSRSGEAAMLADEVLSHPDVEAALQRAAAGASRTQRASATAERSEAGASARTIVIDIGGSGVRMGEVIGGSVAGIRRLDVHTLDGLVAAIQHVDRKPATIALSVPGLVDARRGHVEQCRAVPWVNGNLAEALEGAFHCPVWVINDGSAHALAMKRELDLRLGAICLSLGTSVGFGVLSSDGALLPSLSGLNWEVGGVTLSTRATTQEAWWALGEPGFNELQRDLGTGPGLKRFGYRLGAFARTLTVTFQAQTVGFSGGLVARYWTEMAREVESEMGSPLFGGRKPVLLPLRTAEPALDGLAVLLSE